MTLRARLTTALLTVVLGPVLVGAYFVGSAVAAVDRSRSTERLAVAATAVRASVDALCQQLRAAADAVALADDRAAVAGQVVGRGLAAAVRVTDVAGKVTHATGQSPTAPWRDCSARTPVDVAPGALAVRVDLWDATGVPQGTVTTAQPVDPAFMARLAGVTGAAVTLLGGPDAASRPRHTTEPAGVHEAVLAAAGGLDGERVVGTADGRYVRRVGPSDGQPLPLVLSVPSDRPPGLYAVLVAAVLLVTLLAVIVAGRLARVTTRPLVELVKAVDRVARGDLTARVPVRSRDEVGRLADAFNRMTRETGTYVTALTSSRDQLRGHLAVLGDTLASTHDLQRILRLILHSAIAATGARAGAVLLVEPGGQLVAQATEGIEAPASGSGPIRVPLGDLVGAVTVSGESRRGRVEPSGVPPGEPRCRTYVAEPFAAPRDVGPARGDGPAARPGGPPDGAAPATFGVLALYDRLGGDDFDDDDLVTLRTFAGHAAVAVDNVRVHEEAQRLSLTDPLTGLWNYRYLRQSLRREVERATRFGRMLSVLVLDLDRFKHINDTHGHTAGDLVLVEFARRMRGEIREVDLAFRQGGEEFVVLLPETDALGAAIVAGRLGAAVRGTPIAVGGLGEPVLVPVTVSIGVAVHPDHGGTGQEVLDAADEALYAAKASGRDTWRIAGMAGAATPALELPVSAGSAEGLPRAGARREAPDGPRATRGNGPETDPLPGSGTAAPDGPTSGPHPPRQSRGR
ncbi:diguanylate cyclase [Salinispora arenicola]|uniref:GGDEF domain-containing protein n=1 Tax=Salinispora arenicola TaxID=168697 RepID=UPI0016A488A9|nr:diguanylate cyclase [Salinispora arenicola]NIL57360.1 diguanylate cyclase [Salinispora arenicola]